MTRYFLGVLTAFLFLGSVCGLIFIFDQADVVDIKPSVLTALSLVPGWEEISDAYKLGLERSLLLQEKEKVLQSGREELEEEASRLQAEAERLAAEREIFEAEKTRFERRQQELAVSPNQESAEEAGSAQAAARLLEAMDEKTAGKALLNMPFQRALAALKEMDPRKAGKILGTLPPEKSALFLEEISLK